MINILDKSNNVQEQITSLNVTYKRSVNIIFGHYPFPEEIHNFIIDIKNNIDPSINYSNVKGGMTDWYFFNTTTFIHCCFWIFFIRIIF